MNTVIIMGRLTKDPNIRMSGETKIANFTLAVDRRGKKQEGQPNADFIPCVAFSKSADFVEKWYHKGTKILVRGRIQTGSYQNKDGQTVYTTDVIVEDSEFAESKASSQESRQAAASNGTAMGTNDNPMDGWLNIPDGDMAELPFA